MQVKSQVVFRMWWNLIVEKLDGMVNGVMGKNEVLLPTISVFSLMFILLSYISGLFGHRPPTAGYGVTLALGLITFTLITFNKFRYQKVSGCHQGTV